MMRILLDACIISATFDPANNEHAKYQPLLDWLRTSSKAVLVSGGSKYNAELGQFKKAKYIALLTELQRAGKRLRLDDGEVDREALRIKRLFPKKAFNDEHLAAIVVVGRCNILATNDKVAATYIRSGEVLPPGTQKPRIYLEAKHATLLGYS